MLVALSFAGCAANDEPTPPDPTPGGRVTVSSEEALGGGGGGPFVAVGNGYAANLGDRDAVVSAGRISIGGTFLATDAELRTTVLSADGSLALDRGSSTERLENRPDGLEQSWRFDQPPTEADLVVSVRVVGHRAVTRTDAGLQIRSGADTISYSDATWVDADGVRTSVPVAWSNDHIVMRVPAAVVDASAYPAVLDPVISVEATVEAALPGFTGARAREPAIAQSSDRYLAVWRDDRMSFGSDIFAARINQNGTVQDTSSLRLSFGAGDETQPSVVWVPGSSVWLVSWVVDDEDIAAATVNLGGGVITQLGTVAGTGAVETAPDMARDSGVVLVVYQSDTEIRGRTWSGGAFGAPFVIASGAESAPAVTGGNGAGFLVAWQSGATASDIRGQRVTTAGTLNGAAFDISVDSGVQSDPSATFDGTNYVVTWQSRPTQIWGTRVSTAGVVLDTTGMAPDPIIGGVEIQDSATTVAKPDVSCDATNCTFAWDDRTDAVNQTHGVYGAIRAFDFTAVGGVFTINDGLRHQRNVAMSSRATGGQFVLFDDRASGIHQMSLVRTTNTGTVQDATPILVDLTAYNSQRDPGYARSTAGQLAVWGDSRSFGDDIMARRYNATGLRLDAGALVVSNAAATQNAPAIDFDGTQYVVAWGDTRNPTFDVFFARFLDNGTNVDAGGIALQTGTGNQTAPSVTAGGGGSLVVWQDDSVAGNQNDVAGAIVATNGTFTSFAVCRTTQDQQHPRAAWDATNGVYVVTWEDFRNGNNFDVFATRVQPDGTVLDGCGVSVAGGGGDQRRPEIATAGSQVVLVWEDYASDALGDIRARRANASGALNLLDAGGLAIATGAAEQIHPTVGGLDNGRWSLAWEDWSNVATLGSDVVGNEMASTGALLGPQYTIAGSDQFEHGPKLQSGVNNSNITYIVYQRTRPTSSIVKTMRRKLTH